MQLRVTIHDNAEPATAADRNQLETILKSASDEAQAKNMLGAVILEAENGNLITMVVGGQETVLGFEFDHLEPPYYASRGESDEDQPVLTCFLTFEHHTEFRRRNVIPYADGLKAVAEFLDSGELPTYINWEEV